MHPDSHYLWYDRLCTGSLTPDIQPDAMRLYVYNLYILTGAASDKGVRRGSVPAREGSGCGHVPTHLPLRARGAAGKSLLEMLSSSLQVLLT